MSNSLLVVHVDCRVKPEHVDSFRQASLANARASVGESGIARFDVIQDLDDPAHFVLIEVFRSTEAPAAHKATAHYQVWRDTVAPMMAGPRTARSYRNAFPDDENW